MICEMKAIAAFQKAIQFSPKAPEPLYHLGLLQLAQNKTQEAQRFFEKAISLNPRYAEAHYNLGAIFLSENKLDAALEAFRRSAEANSNYANAYYGAGVVFLKQGMPADARQVLEYAQDLYESQGNTQWATKTTQMLEQTESVGGTP